MVFLTILIDNARIRIGTVIICTEAQKLMKTISAYKISTKTSKKTFQIIERFNIFYSLLICFKHAKTRA
jgi:hypothetical protein